MNSLKVASLWGIDETSSKKEVEDANGIVDSLKLKIVQNLQLVIEDVHLRFEDNTTNPERPIAFGVTLQKVFSSLTGDPPPAI